MKICFAASECVPFAKTGGLADVAGALPAVLKNLDHDVRVFLPLYDTIKAGDFDLTPVENLTDIPVRLGDHDRMFSLWQGKLPGTDTPVYFVDCPHYFHRGRIYTQDSDEDERFILFQNAILIALQYMRWSPDILHCNDWQTGLLPVFLKKTYRWDKLFAETASVLTIHNIGYQGRFSPAAIYKAGLDYQDYYPLGPFEFYGSFSFLKAGMCYADILTTVSETYAREIQTAEFGAGLDGVLRDRAGDLFGVLNGIDTNLWNPAKDTLIPFNYDSDDLSGKTENKKALLSACHLPAEKEAPVIGIIARLADQKGFDLLPPIIDELLHQDIRLITLGSGDSSYEDMFRAMSARYPGKNFAYIGFNNELAHLITAGADMFLMPSRYEPCGLNQMYSLNYGTVPIVRYTGGLADTVIDYDADPENGTGFSFHEYNPQALLDAVRRACALYQHQDRWREVMLRGMHADFSWEKSARKYVALYRRAKQLLLHRTDKR